ncbi:uncharacterized protein LACBIDRAFT_308541 [Laccaria bicolor S238N-H82]|uniref:Predicted protein n=1 Tax=Laccaria bicolor (strain S238N-H82 / ATCC MYA-4686) TaxID=486041 RepID=B0CWL4_LACBS|nr:uncharacterized protein LACBIDRAFT_308541 [Laccaria bicolor S238N-H82]EDR13532.1 predicted protein [Laccaria bicolor S238N-H82]|eukprot:XP_001876030.1 predicted protein [Laccaria bicolor S238N-H82]
MTAMFSRDKPIKKAVTQFVKPRDSNSRDCLPFGFAIHNGLLPTAKALGTLVERLGEIHFPDLVPGLLRTLKTGMERLEGLLPDIIANARSPRPTVREGFMSLLVFLPGTFGTRFQPHQPKIISPILGGLSDTEEYVREAAMRAGRMVVTNYSSKAIDLLLPELEHGMFDYGWRIRQSSITLVGELLFKVSGISGKASEVEEEEVAAGATAESSRQEELGAKAIDQTIPTLLEALRQPGKGSGTALEALREVMVHMNCDEAVESLALAWLLRSAPPEIGELIGTRTFEALSIQFYWVHFHI